MITLTIYDFVAILVMIFCFTFTKDVLSVFILPKFKSKRY